MTNWVADFLARNPDAAARSVVRRHRCALHLDGGDGTAIAYVTGQPLHYQAAPGDWQPIDTTLVARVGGYGAPGVGVLLAADGTVSLDSGSYGHITRRVGLLNPTTRTFTALRTLPAPSVSGDSLVRSVGPFQQTIRLTESGVHEELVLDSAPAGDSAAWLVVEAELSGVSLPAGWADAQWTQDGYSFPAPAATDANGIPLTCRRMARLVAGRQMLYTGVPLSQLATAAYPVTIDPDFTVDTNSGRVLGFDASSSYATAHATGTSDSNNQTINIVGQYKSGVQYAIYRQYLRFDTSSIGSGASVNSVTMTLTCTADSSTTDFDVQIVKYDWSALSPVSSHIDAVYDGILGATADNNIWRNTNGISTNTNYASGALDTTWVSKTGYTYYGLLSSRDKSATTPTGNEYITIGNVANGTPAYRPFITVAYSTGSGPELGMIPFNRPAMHQLMAF